MNNFSNPYLRHAVFPRKEVTRVHSLQKRSLYFALPVIIVPAIGIFFGITIWQVYKKRQAENNSLIAKNNARSDNPSGDSEKKV
jgi:hypothetical protein